MSPVQIGEGGLLLPSTRERDERCRTSPGFWHFGLPITTFVGTVAISWELLHYWTVRRLGPSRSRPEPDRDLAPDLHLSRDTKIGFVVAVMGLTALVAAFQLARLLVAGLP